jgi:hypothetical protein
MTKQHIFGKRLLSFLDEKPATHLIINTTVDDSSTKKREGNIWGKQLRRVCSRCNGGWMRKLEEESFDVISKLISGETNIPHRVHRMLAARIAQIITVADLSVEEDRRAIYQEDRMYLCDEIIAPVDWKIFLVRADVDSNKGQYYHADAFYNTRQPFRVTPEVTKNLVVTMLLGKLCVHVLTRPPKDFKGYTGVTLAALWPLTDEDINLCESSLLSRAKIVELGAAFRRTFPIIPAPPTVRYR